MNGIHDIGGMHGFGRVAVENEAGFSAPWEGRVYAMAALLRARSGVSVDAFRHAIERLPPAEYLALDYFARWIAAMEALLDAAAPGSAGVSPASRPLPDTGEAPALPGVVRPIVTPPRFAVGQEVRARNRHPAGHTRLPRYARGRRGMVRRVHPACIFPDSHAHGRGENPQYVYSVRFAAEELWGEDAEPGGEVCLDLFESYLEPV